MLLAELLSLKNSNSKVTTSAITIDFENNSGSLTYMGSITPPSRGDSDAQRRSQRVMLKVSVLIVARGADNKAVSEETRTVTVNAHGAMVLLALKVSLGQSLTVRNSRTGEEAPCRVVYLSPHQAEKREVGIDFMEVRPQFWRISFPPSDWTTRSPEAKRNPTNTRTDSKKKK